MKTEEELINIATYNSCDKKANSAMKELRDRFDKKYFWCMDCDGLVVKECNCYEQKEVDNDSMPF